MQASTTAYFNSRRPKLRLISESLLESFGNVGYPCLPLRLIVTLPAPSQVHL